MKRKIAFSLFGILFICAGFSVNAETPVIALDDTSEQHAENITNILKASGLKKSFEQIRTESAYLSFTQKELLFSLYKNKPLAPFLLNGLIGLGVGSFIQNDYLSGGLCLTADIASFGLGIAGLIAWQKEFYSMAYKAEQSADALFGMVFSIEKVFPFLIAGGVLSIASRVYGMVSPWVYGALYNKRLEQALRIGEARLSLAPLVMPDASCGLALRLEF